MILTRLAAEQQCKTLQVPVLNDDGTPVLDDNGTPVTEPRSYPGCSYTVCTAWLSNDEMDWLTSDSPRKAVTASLGNRTYMLYGVYLIPRNAKACEDSIELTHCDLGVECAVPLNYPKAPNEDQS